MKKISFTSWKVIIPILILAFIFFPKSLSSRVNLNKLPQNDFIIEVIHRNNLNEGGTVTSTRDITKLGELENFLDQYKSIPSFLEYMWPKNLGDEESYTINFKNDEEFLNTIVLYRKNFEVLPGKGVSRSYNVIGKNVDFNFLEEFTKSMN